MKILYKSTKQETNSLSNLLIKMTHMSFMIIGTEAIIIKLSKWNRQLHNLRAIITVSK